MKRVVAISILLMFAAAAQSPTSLPRFFVSYKLAGEGATAPFRTSWIYVDDPLEIAVVDGVAKLRVKPEHTCIPQDKAFYGTQQESYPLLNRNMNCPLSVYVNGLFQIEGRGYNIAADGLSLSLVVQFENPEILIRYCSTQ